MANENWNFRSTGARQRISNEEIRAILNSSESSNDFFSGDDDVDMDVDYIPEVESDHDDHEYIEGDENNEPNIEISGSQTNYLSKNKEIVWHTTPPPDSLSRARSENIIHGRMGVTTYAIHRINNITDSFNICFTSAMKQVIIKFTNIEGKRVYKDSFVEIGEAELDAYLGVLLLIGVYRSHDESIQSLWDESHGRPILRAVMSMKRFQVISRLLAFDNRELRRSQCRGDKLAPIRDFYEMSVDNLKVIYAPHEYITVDEQLITFRGRCPFKVYIPSKPGKYGIKAWVAADATTGFCLNFKIYTGKENKNAPPEKNQAERVVLDLVSNYQGRNITADNFFTTYRLALELLKKNITLVGTVRKNKTFLPEYASPQELRKVPEYTSTFFFNDKVSLVQYVPKKFKLVTVMSTFHHKGDILQDHSKKIPKMIEFYNSTKAGVDRIDQMVRNYSSKRKTNRWPVALFGNFLDLSALNAYIIWTEINPTWKQNTSHKRRIFLEELGNDLVRPWIAQRNRVPHAPSSAAIVNNVRSSEGSNELVPPMGKKKKSNRKRCNICPPGTERKTFNHCAVCKTPVCLERSQTKTERTTYCRQHIQ